MCCGKAAQNTLGFDLSPANSGFGKYLAADLSAEALGYLQTSATRTKERRNRLDA
jgi:hypothetical protein